MIIKTGRKRGKAYLSELGWLKSPPLFLLLLSLELTASIKNQKQRTIHNILSRSIIKFPSPFI